MKGVKGSDSRDTQNLIIWLCLFVYSMAYFGRYSFSSSINSLIENYGVSKAETGLVMTFFFVSYGVGQVINGIFCRHYPPRYIFPMALTGSAAINLLLFAFIETGYIADYFYLVKYIWLLNGIAQSFLWTSIIFILGKNIEKSNVPKAGLVIGMSVPGGTFLAYSVSSLFAHYKIFEYSFVLAAVMMLIAAFTWMFLFSPHKRQNETEEQESKAEEQPGAKHKISRLAAFTFAGLAVFAVSNNFVKDGLHTWIPTILKEMYNFKNSASLILATAIYVLGVFGAVAVKKANAKIKNLVSLAIVFFTAMAIFIGFITAFLNVSSIPVILFFTLVMITSYGLNNIVTSLGPLDLRSEINPGVAAGLLDGFCYVGSALSTYVLGVIADNYKWHAVLLTVLFIVLLATAVASTLRILSKRKQQ
ncbi:MAG: MFS transporter [Clostridia bacterium]|nr:MFS transporter [Clostridia bacterium]